MGTGMARAERRDRSRDWRGSARRRTVRADMRNNEPAAERRRAAGFEAIEVLRGRGVTQEFPRHWHDEVYLCAALSGRSYLDCRGSSVLMRRGALAMVAPGDVHANRKIGCSFRCVLMEFGAMQRAVEQFIERNCHAV